MIHSAYPIQGPTLDHKITTLHERFEQQAKANSEVVALRYGTQETNYGELSQQINQTAHYFWEQGMRPHHIVTLSLDRSPELIIAMFAILQCGAAYVPIDVHYPQKRVQTIIEDAQAQFAIGISESTISENTTAIGVATIIKERTQFPITPLPVRVDPESVAYIIYTSGSTGTPKGVQVSHRNTINLIYSMQTAPGIQKEDRIFAVTTISFDAMVMETFLPLLCSATVVLVDEETRLDGELLLKKAQDEAITVLWGTPSIWQILLDSGWETPLPIKALIGGEPVPLPLAHKLLTLCDSVWNIYGPTETTVCAFLTAITKDDDPIVIGKPVANTYAYILDTEGRPVAPGETGEIVIGGSGVSLGYLNRPELTRERFIDDPFHSSTGEKLYFSGDLGKVLPSGKVQCLGRKDLQVKVRGHRIELGEIEAVIDTFAEIKKNTVIVHRFGSSEPKLIAYLQGSSSEKDTQNIRKQLEEILPDFMIPSLFMWVDTFPITSNGKIDKQKLPPPKYERPDTAPPFKKPKTQLEKTIATLWSEQLGIPSIGIDDNFFEMGGTSLRTQKVATLLKKQLGRKVPVTKLYQYPTIASLTQFLEASQQQNATPAFQPQVNIEKRAHTQEIAVIGMAGRFPGATSIDALWEVLKTGQETISFFTSEELDPSIPEALRNDPLYVKARGIVPSATEFDPLFFGINPKLASVMDPQQRLFLEIAWEALEQSGYLPKHYSGSIGVYAGTGTNTYYKNNILPNTEIQDQVGVLQANTVNEKDYIASRTAYHLDLKGPAVSVQSACSTSLLAISEAVEAIRNHQCDIALAGGASVTAPIYSGHRYQEGSMLSADGHCRSFDVEAKGTVFSDGAGVVLLKRLSEAKKDGDVIYGVIKGVGINNDGGGKGSFTAPSVDGQADAITRALRDAQVTPASISYIEAHGTATPLGDPIEMEGLHKAFGAQDQEAYCAIGTIKSNMGHLTAAAGVAGLIKTLLALQHQQIPPSLGFSAPNPAIDFTHSPFFVNTTLKNWQSDTIRRAGISSFGVGGTNVHVIVEEYQNTPKSKVRNERPLQLLPWSAKTETSVGEYQKKLAAYCKANGSAPLADIAFTLATTKEDFKYRRFTVSENLADATKHLSSETIPNLVYQNTLAAIPDEIAFLFPGQGSQFLNMGKQLYENETVFRTGIDECAAILLETFSFDIREVIYPKQMTTAAENRLQDTQFTQPALFVIGYALAQLWKSWGIQPTLLCGHSVGEFVAAHLSGILTLQDALHLVALRGQMVNTLPEGSMLSVRAPLATITPLLPETLSVAAINSDQLCVISGKHAAIETFIQDLEQKNIPNRLLRTSHAFHSTMMDPIIEDFENAVRNVTLSPPKIPIVSTVTGTWLSDTEAVDPEYWANHLRATVDFSKAMDTTLAIEDLICLEVGPGQTLTTLSQQKKNKKSMVSIASLGIPKENENSYHTILPALGQLWANGVPPNWTAFYEKQSLQKVVLPTYVFDRKHCWIPPIVSENMIQKNTIVTKTNYNQPIPPPMNTVSQPDRKTTLLTKVSEIILSTSGTELTPTDYDYNFLELGLDSLVLTQMAITCKNEFKIPITFRQLNDEFNTPSLLVNHLDATLPPERFAPAPSAPIAANESTAPLANTAIPIPNQTASAAPANYAANGTAIDLIAQQIQLLGKQLELLRGSTPPPAVPATPITNTPTAPATTNTSEEVRSKAELKAHSKPFGASPKIERQASDLNDEQLLFLNQLIQKYNAKTAQSKAHTQDNRKHMADPRVVSGFKPLTKELVYPIVVEKSSGNRLWDLDGNEYIDTLNGFGSCLFGHQPDFIKDALHQQIERGFEVGPQHPLAAEVCKLLCEFTGHDRAALCNTGSEAVLGAMRIARTVTGRSLVIAFTGSYHGINDEAIVRGSKKLKTFPAAAGILSNAVQNVLLLDYGTEESLAIIRERAHEIAAVLVEPVQSRRPEFQPIEFLKEIRKITKESEALLIFDEIITGFRMHPGGTQAMFNIKADLASYGKVIGGGMSIGAILGASEYMDALDGGFWQYGDASFPEVGVTYFAGTFVRHPLALAAAKASLLFMKEQGIALQQKLTAMAEGLVTALNQEFEIRKLPMMVNHFGSLWRIKFTEDIPYSELLFVMLRAKGIHIWDGFPCFVTNAYLDEDIERVKTAILSSIDELIAAGILKTRNIENDIARQEVSHTTLDQFNTPPRPDAKLGRDEHGNPAWFVADPEKSGAFIKIDV